jgi:hypothetical protein
MKEDRMRNSSITLAVLISLMMPGALFRQTDDVSHDLKLAMLQLTDVSIRSDVQGLKDVQSRFEKLIKQKQAAATAYYGHVFNAGLRQHVSAAVAV